jgi:hypothetical protein
LVWKGETVWVGWWCRGPSTALAKCRESSLRMTEFGLGEESVPQGLKPGFFVEVNAKAEALAYLEAKAVCGGA